MDGFGRLVFELHRPDSGRMVDIVWQIDTALQNHVNSFDGLVQIHARQGFRRQAGGESIDNILQQGSCAQTDASQQDAGEFGESRWDVFLPHTEVSLQRFINGLFG